jgi:hypothetical protein
MNQELGFNIGDRYSIALLVFFITYFIFEIPSNVVLRKVGAANWLAFLCMSWGIVVFGAGFAKKWEVSRGSAWMKGMLMRPTGYCGVSIVVGVV